MSLYSLKNDPKNQYHGYHMQINSHEIPQKLKKRLLSTILTNPD